MTNQLNQYELLSQAMDLIVESGADLKTLFDQDGLLKKLTKSLVERALNAELSAHLGYDKYERIKSTNARNGTSKKHILTDNGTIELEIPRDRNNYVRLRKINGLFQAMTLSLKPCIWRLTTLQENGQCRSKTRVQQWRIL